MSDYFIEYTPEVEVVMMCLKYHLSVHGKVSCLSLKSSIKEMIKELKPMTVCLHPLSVLEETYAELGEDFYVEYVNAILDEQSC